MFEHLKGYSLSKFQQDVKAGVNVALLDFPQGMAYAMIAGLPVPFGIYSSAIGSITGPLLASSRFLMLGPTNATAALLLSGFLALNLTEAQKLFALPLLLVMIGLIMILGALIRADVVIKYVSRSVITGYISAAALLIIVNQVKHMLGVEAERTATFWSAVVALSSHVKEVDWATVILSAGTMGLYFALKRWAKALPAVALALVASGVGAYVAKGYGYAFTYLPSMSVGSWPMTVPHFDMQMIRDLMGVACAVAFLSLLESASIAKTLAAKAGDTVNVKKQMISMGVADIANAFGSGMPVSGSLTRSALNYSSGAKTPISSMTSGVILVVGALLLGPMIGYIPKAALAALVVTVGLSLIKLDVIKVMLRTTRSDAVTFLATFVVGLIFSLDTAIYVGVGVSLILFLHKVSTPQLVEMSFNERDELAERPAGEEKPAISIVHVEGDLFFGSTDMFQDQMRFMASHGAIKVIVLRMKNAHNMDATSALAVGEFVEHARRQGVATVVSGLHAEVERVFENSGLCEIIGRENLFRYTPENVTLSTRNALKRAQEILGTKKADILLFAKEKPEA